MTEAEQIIVRRIHELDERMEWELDAQIVAESEHDKNFDMDASDRYWTELFNRMVELKSVLAEIQGCTITDLVLE